MKITKTPFEGLLIIEPRIFDDERGFFCESYNQSAFQKIGIEMNFVQDNQSRSKRGVLRGLHFQKQPYAQTKLVRVLSGVILDVVVDLRKVQPTFGKHYSIELSSENMKQLLVPKGFAHGFLVLSDFADVLYKCDEFYNPAAEHGILYNDPDLNIDWQLKQNLLVSAKDLSLSNFTRAENLF